MSKVILSNLLRASNFPERSLYAAVLFLGTNDSVLGDLDDRAVPLDEYKENLRQIIDEMEKYGIPRERILTISPPPIDVIAWGQMSLANGNTSINLHQLALKIYQIYFNYFQRPYCLSSGFSQSFSNESVSKYAAACSQISQDLNIQNLDLWTNMQKLEVKIKHSLLSLSYHHEKGSKIHGGIKNVG